MLQGSGLSQPTPDLIEAARQGNTEALHTLLVRYQPDVTKFARSVCATPEDAENAVQEALWIAARKVGTLRVASTFTAWLFQVVKHECYRLWRRVHREALRDSHLAMMPTGGSLADQAALAHDLAAAIAALPLPYRQVLIMRDVQGMTAPEVAVTLGITVETVKSRLHRARTSLRTSLKSWNYAHSAEHVEERNDACEKGCA